MPATPGPKLLLVEGMDDLLVVAEVFEKATGTPWEPTKGQRSGAPSRVRSSTG